MVRMARHRFTCKGCGKRTRRTWPADIYELCEVCERSREKSRALIGGLVSGFIAGVILAIAFALVVISVGVR